LSSRKGEPSYHLLWQLLLSMACHEFGGRRYDRRGDFRMGKIANELFLSLGGLKS
jgi:hypothetical protein